MLPDVVSMNRLWRETLTRLDVLSRRVQEGKDLDAAKEFCQYLLWSGIIKLLKENPSPEPIPCDGYLVEHLANGLHSRVMDRYRTNDISPQIELTELEKINRNLALIAGRLAQVMPLKTDSAPALYVLPGGQDCESQTILSEPLANQKQA